MKLYHYYRSSCSWRLRWALNLKGLKYSKEHIHLLKDEQKTTFYTKLNSSQAVPSLVVDKQSYSESIALIEWLDETYPEPQLLPKKPFERLYVRELAFVIAAGTQPLQNLHAQKYFSKDKDKRLSYAQYWIKRGLSIFEEKLQAKKLYGKFSFEDNLSLADLCLVPQCYNAERFAVDLNQFKTIKSIYINSLDLSSCKESSPENFQPI